MEKKPYRKCGQCRCVMVGIVDGGEAPARLDCDPCGGRPLTAHERNMLKQRWEFETNAGVELKRKEQ